MLRGVDAHTGFLSGGGQLGELIRRHDWRASPIGPQDAWPQALKTLVSVMLGANQPMFIVWRGERTLLYNDAYAAILGNKHPSALGQDFLEVWSEIQPDLVPLVEQAYSCVPVHMPQIELVMLRKGYPEETHFSFSYTPIYSERGDVCGFFCPCTEITAQVMGERRQAFLLELGDVLRDLAEPAELTEAAAALLGRNLQAGRAGYGEINAGGDVVSVERDWSDGNMASLAGEARVLDAFGSEMIAELRAGRTLIVEDCLTDVRSASADHQSTWRSIGTRALIVVPLVRADQLIALLYVHSAEPRRWSELEVTLAEDVARRTWAALERSRAERALRRSEAQFRLMADAVPQIVWITDASGRIDFFNRHWSDYTGASLQPETADEVANLYIHPDDVAVTMAQFEDAQRSGGAFLVEHRIRSADGQYRWSSRAARRIATPVLTRSFAGMELPSISMTGNSPKQGSARTKSGWKSSTRPLKVGLKKFLLSGRCSQMSSRAQLRRSWLLISTIGFSPSTRRTSRNSSGSMGSGRGQERTCSI